MNKEDKDNKRTNEPRSAAPTGGLPPEQWTFKGKPLKVLSTSLGVALVANLLLAPAAYGDTAANQDEPKLVKWSTDAVKAYYDPQMDWNIPLAPGKDDGADGEAAGSQGSAQGSGTTAPIIVHNGFGWSDLLLYHLIFNSGRSYSSTDWYGSRRVYDPQTNTTVKPRTYNSDTFQNKPTTGSVVRPKTVNRSGSLTRRGSSSGKSTSSTRGGIGSRSGGFSSGFGG